MKDQLYATLRQLVMLFESLTIHRLLINRFVLVIVLMLAITGVVQGYMSMNDNGHIQGQVVDENGDPVAGAEVTIERMNIRNQFEGANTTTDENGYYEFTDQTTLLEFRIRVTKDEATVVERHHLYFRGQDKEINLVLESND